MTAPERGVGGLFYAFSDSVGLVINPNGRPGRNVIDDSIRPIFLACVKDGTTRYQAEHKSWVLKETSRWVSEAE